MHNIKIIKITLALPEQRDSYYHNVLLFLQGHTYIQNYNCVYVHFENFIVSIYRLNHMKSFSFYKYKHEG